jgi:hypothetical protein
MERYAAPGAENMHAIAMGLEKIWRKEQGQ